MKRRDKLHTLSYKTVAGGNTLLEASLVTFANYNFAECTKWKAEQRTGTHLVFLCNILPFVFLQKCVGLSQLFRGVSYCDFDLKTGHDLIDYVLAKAREVTARGERDKPADLSLIY
jgi:hypothetical protein